MRFGSGIFGVYAPVLLAAVLVLTVAPSCFMPACGPTGGAPVTACEAPQSQQFTSACELDADRVPTSAPHGEGDCDETAMSHGTPDAVVAQAFEPPMASALAQAPAPVAIVALDAGVKSVTPTDVHPPDPLGVRLTV